MQVINITKQRIFEESIKNITDIVINKKYAKGIDIDSLFFYVKYNSKIMTCEKQVKLYLLQIKYDIDYISKITNVPPTDIEYYTKKVHDSFAKGRKRYLDVLNSLKNDSHI